MMYWLSQVMGVLVAAVCVISSQMRYKWQMLLCSMVANIFSALSFLFLGGALTAMMLNVVGIVNTLLFSIKSYKGLPLKLPEKLIFLVAYLILGVVNIKRYLDILPCMGSLLFCIGTLIKKEQHIRCVNLASNSVWIAYDIAVGTTGVIAQALSFVSTLIALYRYRDKSKRSMT